MNTPVKLHFSLEQDEDGYPPASVESLWAQPGKELNELVIDSVPFFVRDVTLGDTVRFFERDGLRWFDGLIKRSRNSLVRVVFFDKSCVNEVGDKLKSMGCSTEYLGVNNLMSVSIPFDVILADVQSYLQAVADTGRIDFEEPILRQG